MIMQDLHTRSDEGPDFAAKLLEIMRTFRRYSDIEVNLLWDNATMTMSPRMTRETLRIIQEAVLNIHKHSHATHAIVELKNAGSELLLVISDNGTGLEFDGRFT